MNLNLHESFCNNVLQVVKDTHLLMLVVDVALDMFIFFLADTYTCPILGPLIPLFLISGDVSSGFQKPERAALFALWRQT